jgi:hypothetical protein
MTWEEIFPEFPTRSQRDVVDRYSSDELFSDRKARKPWDDMLWAVLRYRAPAGRITSNAADAAAADDDSDLEPYLDITPDALGDPEIVLPSCGSDIDD